MKRLFWTVLLVLLLVGIVRAQKSVNGTPTGKVEPRGNRIGFQMLDGGKKPPANPKPWLEDMSLPEPRTDGWLSLARKVAPRLPLERPRSVDLARIFRTAKRLAEEKK